MKLYIDIKKMTFDEDGIEREIIVRVGDVEFPYYDYIIELPDDGLFIQDTLEIERDDDGKEINRMFCIGEKDTWWSFPLYQIIDGVIVSFDYTQYQYFADTDRRMTLAGKISKLYNPSSEAKVLRKTLKYVMDELNIIYPKSFEKYDNKIEALIAKNSKEK